MTEPPANSVHPTTREEWRAWLQQNHTRGEGVWFVAYKRATGLQRLEYEAAVEEALCFGWIDGQAKTVDDTRLMQWYAPRKKGSGWSAVNKGRIERLIAEGRMAPPGLAKIEAAKQDGSWTSLDAVEALEVPDDLQAALAGYPDARHHFDAFPRSAKKLILGWIVSAKRPETRTKRIEETARLAQENVRAFPRLRP